MTPTPHDSLIRDLASNLQPVRPMRRATGMAWVALAAASSLAVVLVSAGLRSGLDTASALFFIANGLLGILGLASAATVVAMASPRVGNRHDGPKWTMAMAGVLPLATVIALANAGHDALDLLRPADGGHCFVFGTLAGLTSAAAMTWWLRQGAPTSPRLAGLYLGVAAGAIGSVTYGLSCPVDSVVHLGSWHVFPVIASGAAGALAIPPLLRW